MEVNPQIVVRTITRYKVSGGGIRLRVRLRRPTIGDSLNINEWYDQIIKELLKHTAGLYKK
jgi:hypothetical protein